MDQRKRSLIKTITWRLIAFATTWIVVYLYSKEVKVSLAIAITTNGLNMLFYYVHERIWNRTSFGKQKREAEPR